MCLEKRQRARNEALQGRVPEASRLLDEVKAQCGPSSAVDIQHISRLIESATRANLERARAEAAERELRERVPSRHFVAWATEKDGSVDDKAGDAECAERGSPDFGFCEARRQGSPSMSVRYWQARKEAYRYAFSTREPPSCQDLGEHRLVRSWRRDGRSFELCELTNRRLRHLSALLVLSPPEQSPPEHQMYIFSQAYLAQDPTFERSLRTIQPRP